MAKKPLNPDSVKGGGMPAMGRSSQGASAAANKRAGAGAAAKSAQAKTGRTLAYPDNYKARFAQIDRMFSNMGSVRPASAPLPKSPRVIKPQPAAGSVEQVKLTAKQFGQKVSGRQARAISALLRGRTGGK